MADILGCIFLVLFFFGVIVWCAYKEKKDTERYFKLMTEAIEKGIERGMEKWKEDKQQQ